MPRHNGLIWKYFTALKKGKYKSGVCKFCGEVYISNANRMKNHLVNKCQTVPAEIKKMFISELKDQNRQISRSAGKIAPIGKCEDTINIDELETNSGNEEGSQSTTSRISTNQDEDKENRIHRNSNKSSMLGYLDFCGPKEKAELDVLLARAMFATATPFQIVDNPYWIEFFKHLRPAYSLPSRYCISKPLLDKEYKLIKETMNIKMEEANALTLVSDGWTDNTGNSIINILFCTPKPIFFKSVSSNCESHTGEFISGILIDAIESVGHQKVYAVITDNAANMKNAWNILHDKYPHLIIFGCLAHGINLLIKDIIAGIPIFNNTLRDVKEIIKFFKNRQLPREMLKKHQMENGGKLIALSLAVDTRWGSNAKMLESIIKCQEHIEAITVNRAITRIMPETFRRTILDVNFWPLVENIHQLLKVPSDAITNLEGDSANLSYINHTLKKMEKDLKQKIHFMENEDQVQVMQYFEIRKKFVSHPSQLAAHFLNCKLRNIPLDEQEESDAIDYIVDLGLKLNLSVEKLYADIGEYNAKASIWSKKSLWKAADLMEPSTWWKGLCGKRELSRIAVILLSIPATAAASERNWSCFGNIKTLKRNRLNTITLMKLVAIKFNLNIHKDLVVHPKRSHKREALDGEVEIKTMASDGEIDVIQSSSEQEEEDEELEEIILQFDSDNENDTLVNGDDEDLSGGEI